MGPDLQALSCVHVIAGDLWAGAEVATLAQLVELARRPGMTVRCIVLNPGELADRLERAGIETAVLSETGSSFPALVREVTSRLRRWRPHVIHTHRYKEHLLGCVASACCGAFHVRSVHGLPPQPVWRDRKIAAARMLDDWLADIAGSTWIAVSLDLAGRLRGLRRSVHVIPNGLEDLDCDVRPQDPGALFPSATPGRYVGFVGRLEPVKRPDRFLRVFAQLPSEVGGREVRAVVLGDGSLGPELERMLAGTGCASRVRLLGHRPDGERWVAALDVLLLSSDHEGHPMVVLEAMRAGVPVAAPAVGGIEEVLGRSPFVAPAGDEAGLTAAVRRLLEDSAARDRWVDELRRLFETRYAIRRNVDRLLDVYRRGAAGGRP